MRLGHVAAGAAVRVAVGRVVLGVDGQPQRLPRLVVHVDEAPAGFAEGEHWRHDGECVALLVGLDDNLLEVDVDEFGGRGLLFGELVLVLEIPRELERARVSKIGREAIGTASQAITESWWSAFMCEMILERMAISLGSLGGDAGDIAAVATAWGCCAGVKRFDRSLGDVEAQLKTRTSNGYRRKGIGLAAGRPVSSPFSHVKSATT